MPLILDVHPTQERQELPGDTSVPWQGPWLSLPQIYPIVFNSRDSRLWNTG